ncbi:hypothetical protein [Planococcus sp. YIM B11945]|uniref:hypothetical protein n=1 Tax=Planococcus sp. YIM B11945 TaxID=3435410 RepID=UPI003D7F143A
MKKKCLVHTAFGNEQYFKAVQKFSEHGVSYDVGRKTDNGGILSMAFGDSNRTVMPFADNARIDNTQYDFYVTKEDEHLAIRALR